jgi:hypothetical protein
VRNQVQKQVLVSLFALVEEQLIKNKKFGLALDMLEYYQKHDIRVSRRKCKQLQEMNLLIHYGIKHWRYWSCCVSLVDFSVVLWYETFLCVLHRTRLERMNCFSVSLLVTGNVLVLLLRASNFSSEEIQSISNNNIIMDRGIYVCDILESTERRPTNTISHIMYISHIM